MKLSYNWLKDYVDVTLDPEKLAERLTMAGVNVASMEKVGGDYIFELEITSNRPDCLNIIGLSREIGAIIGKKIKIPQELEKTNKIISDKKDSAISISVKDTDLCYRYTGLIIKNVEVGPSPEWLREKIISVGLRPVNNIVDITNFVLFETGQPMHAFDLDKISGDISVRRAIKGEKIITIDNVPRTCEDDMLVIADSRGPMAIAGVMGGIDTEVNSMTKNIILESAFFNPISIRRTSRTLGHSSESSYRFERRIDNSMVFKASERAAVLIEKLAGGKRGASYDIGKKTCYSKTININAHEVSNLLGVSINKNRAEKILKTLGFSVKNKKESLTVTVPSFREDVKTSVDVAEELARIYGYDKIPATIPRIVENSSIKDSIDILLDKIKVILPRVALSEIITYSLIKKSDIDNMGFDEKEIVFIANPLSIDQEIMRPVMLFGILKVLARNLNRKAQRIALFEIGKIYKKKSESYKEKHVLSFVLSGIKEENWKSGKREFSFFDLKGILEKLLEDLGIADCSFVSKASPYFDKSISSSIKCNKEIIGIAGEVEKETLKNFDVEKKVFYGELYLEKLYPFINLNRRYKHLNRYPSIVRDISVVADASLASSQITEIITEIGSKLVKDISLVDQYKGKQIPAGKKGLLYRIEYRSEDRTLEDSKVDVLHNAIKNTLEEKLNISFR